MLENTLYGLLNSIETKELVLPAMQRPFVWKEDRLYRLMDSLLRGFPIGAVMLWKTSTTQRYRNFPNNIDETIDQVFTFETSSNNSNKYLVLDGQQRLTSLFCMFKGTYNNKILHINILSGESEDKDPGNEYYECQFITEVEAKNINDTQPDVHFLSVKELLKINPINAAKNAQKKSLELELNDDDSSKVANVYIRCANIWGNSKSLQIIVVDEDQQDPTPIEEILEIFVRVNSGGLVLQKSDLLMSLLDLTWNDIQPELQGIVRSINKDNPYQITRDDVLKSLLLAEGAETRFDRLVTDRNRIEDLSKKLPSHIKGIENAWKILLIILKDKCKIYSERFLRGGHNSLLPFVVHIYKNPTLPDSEKRCIAFSLYITLISGIFGSAESRMNSFTRKQIENKKAFPLEKLVELIKTKFGVSSLDSLLRHSLDLALNLAHGGISLNNNPEELQRDHIFPRSKRIAENIPSEKVNHYANFHFLRGVDNLNKTDIEPDIWFKNPGKGIPPYSSNDLEERLLTWDDLKQGNFLNMIEIRGKKIREKACSIFGYAEEEINDMFK
jgi:uncharacterized protein with ParB-like and HNH nuclease domain